MRSLFLANPVLALGVLAWLIAQVIKVLLNVVQRNTWDLKILLSSGGMPSSHSAFVCAIAGSIAQMHGLNSTLFALAAALALVVMYDACNIRRAAGEQAKILNYLLGHLDQISPELAGKALQELLGHTPLQVFMGALLGIAVGTGGGFWLQ